MEWIRTILPLFGVVIGWVLSESGKIFANKREDRKKLKKLLFFLLELRYHFAKELSNELDVDKYIKVIKDKMAERFGVDINGPQFTTDAHIWTPLLKQVFSKNHNQEDKLEFLSKNIDNVLIELAEIFPILSYELNGRHNIKERLTRAEGVFDELNSFVDEMPFDVKQWINPKLTEQLLNDLDESIKRIAREINKKAYNQSREKIEKMKFGNDPTKMNMLIDEYFDKIIENHPR
jgi:hypothetical protein